MYHGCAIYLINCIRADAKWGSARESWAYVIFNISSILFAVSLRPLREGHMSCKAAAKAFGVPRTTLRDKLAGRSPEERQMGPNSVLPKLRRLLW